MSRMLTRSQAMVSSIGTLAILALTSLTIAGMLGTEQWFMFSLAVFLASDVISGHYTHERLRNLRALVFFICVVIFFIVAANKLLAVLGVLL